MSVWFALRQEALHSKNLAFNSAMVVEGESVVVSGGGLHDVYHKRTFFFLGVVPAALQTPMDLLLSLSCLPHPVGRGLGIVVRTGDHTMIGSIASLVGETKTG